MDVRRNTSHSAMLSRRPRVPQANALFVPRRHKQDHIQEQSPSRGRLDGRIRLVLPQGHTRLECDRRWRDQGSSRSAQTPPMQIVQVVLGEHLS